jgi:purine-nucleoside phosphorylase
LHTGYYDLEWTGQAQQVGAAQGVLTVRGTYAWTRGPSYETRAEVRMLSTLGADAVGMSTVPEVLQAHALGMDVLGISTITNFAAGLGHEVLEHEDVLKVGQQVRGDLRTLVRAIVEKT